MEPRSLASRGLWGDERPERPELGEGLEGGGGSLGSSVRGGSGEILGEVEAGSGVWVGPVGGGGPGGRGVAPGGAAVTAARSTISLATPSSPTGVARPHPARATHCTTLAAARRPPPTARAAHSPPSRTGPHARNPFTPRRPTPDPRHSGTHHSHSAGRHVPRGRHVAGAREAWKPHVRARLRVGCESRVLR